MVNGGLFVLHAMHGEWLDASLNVLAIVALGLLWDSAHD